MTKIVVDAEMQAKLHAPEGLLELCDSSGQTFGYFLPAGANGAGPPPRSPFTREQIEEFRKQRVGKPLSEILERLQKS